VEVLAAMKNHKSFEEFTAMEYTSVSRCILQDFNAYVMKFKFLGMTVIYQNYMHKEFREE
jgi:hypothetical protein